MELYHITHFLAFAECGNISKAAEKVHTSQPALSRAMKALEDELEVPLFTRTKNKIELNDYGRLAVHYAQNIADSIQNFNQVLRETYRRERTITIASAAPAPLWKLIPLLSSLYPDRMINSASGTKEELLKGLDRGDFQLAITTEPMSEQNYFCKQYGSEHLFFCAPKGHRLQNRTELSFAEIDGETMLLMNDIGIWHDIHKKMMPNSRFIRQDHRADFITLVETSELPSFSTDVTQKSTEWPQNNRTHIPITDKEAFVTYYAVCLKQNYANFRDFFDSF